MFPPRHFFPLRMLTFILVKAKLGYQHVLSGATSSRKVLRMLIRCCDLYRMSLRGNKLFLFFHNLVTQEQAVRAVISL